MSQSNVLEKIVADKRLEVEARQNSMPLYAIQPGLEVATRNFYQALKTDKANNGAGFILEIKKASPSKGLIRENFDLEEICDAYQHYASCVSVLTDEKYFQGDFERLPKVREMLSQPLLCKDFFISEYQVYLARFYGADAILLMLSVLSDSEYTQLAKVATELGMDILTEVSNEEEMERAVKLDANIIGINNRNLRDLSTDLAQTPRLVKLYKSIASAERQKDTLIISESGIYTHQHVAQLSSISDGFLVGSSLMAQKKLLPACRSLIVGKTKVCGITRSEDLVVLADAGADYAGIISVNTSPRFISQESIKNIVDAASSELPKQALPKLVLVTRNQRQDEILSYLNTANFSAIQLHGDEDNQYIQSLVELLREHDLDCEVWKAVGASASKQAQNTSGVADDSQIESGSLMDSLSTLDKTLISKVVIDTVSNNGQSGGTGESFNWRILDELSEQFDVPEVILAGGLSPDNIKQASTALTSGFDLNSGVEERPGIKSTEKISHVFNILFGRYEAKGKL